MPEQLPQKIQPQKALSSSALEEDENPDFSKQNLRVNEPTCSIGASISKSFDQKTEHLRNSAVGDEFGASNAVRINNDVEKVTTKENYDDE